MGGWWVGGGCIYVCRSAVVIGEGRCGCVGFDHGDGWGRKVLGVTLIMYGDGGGNFVELMSFLIIELDLFALLRYLPC